MNIQISTKMIYAKPEDERWTVEVEFFAHTLNRETFRVYIDTHQLHVSPSGCAKRNTFGWEDWIFENLDGDVEAAAMIAALAVFVEPDEVRAKLQSLAGI